MYKPHVPLGILAGVSGIAGIIPFIRFLVYWFQGESGGHVQSLIFGTAMIVTSLLSAALLVVADLQRTNRVLIEDTLERVKALQYGQTDAQTRQEAPREDSADLAPSLKEGS